MAQVLGQLPQAIHPDLLVGPEHRDDAAVYRITPDTALVYTADFITPVVDDPVAFGAIAAANALSDVYAMGGTPFLAINLVGFPRQALDLSILSEILSSAAAVVHESGAITAGGHTIDDPELKFGLSVIGRVHPDRVVRNSDARPGDRLYLTKPLGVGVVTTAIKRGAALRGVDEVAVAQMRQTNRAAANAMDGLASAATDVSGFGLLGHLGELAAASGVRARVEASSVAVIDGVERLAADGYVPDGSRRNLDAALGFTRFGPGVTETTRLILADAQTSGGLLLSIPAEHSTAVEGRLQKEGLTWSRIGVVEDGPPGAIAVD